MRKPRTTRRILKRKTYFPLSVVIKVFFVGNLQNSNMYREENKNHLYFHSQGICIIRVDFLHLSIQYETIKNISLKLDCGMFVLLYFTFFLEHYIRNIMVKIF